jgi:hypothetical protein
MNPMSLYYPYIWPQLCWFGLGEKVIVPRTSELQSVLLGCLSSDFVLYLHFFTGLLSVYIATPSPTLSPILLPSVIIFAG